MPRHPFFRPIAVLPPQLSRSSPRRTAYRPFPVHSTRIPVRPTSSGTFAQRPVHAGHTTYHPTPSSPKSPSHPFYLDTGYALFAKRSSRPFPPPFSVPTPRPEPSAPDFDALPTHDHLTYKDHRIRGATNGDDALLAEPTFVAAADGVGAWAARQHGHAALWSRLLLHYWGEGIASGRSVGEEDEGKEERGVIEALQRAYETTRDIATGNPPYVWYGTTTAVGASLVVTSSGTDASPLLHVANLGDSKVLVIRPSTGKVIHRTTEQWHWFDCPRQLGTNSPDSPREHAVHETVPLLEDDVVVAATDGLVDNLWEHEVLASVLRSLERLEESGEGGGKGGVGQENEMMWVAEELVREARTVAEDPFAESPFMERAVEEGVGFEGGESYLSSLN